MVIIFLSETLFNGTVLVETRSLSWKNATVNSYGFWHDR